MALNSRMLLAQRSFTGGILAPSMYGRTNIEKYQNGLENALNCYLISPGPVIRRNGTKFISEVKTSSKAVKLIRFQLSANTGFIIELGDQYMRFYQNGAQIESGCAAYEISTPWTEAQLSEVAYAQFGTKMYLTHPDVDVRVLTYNSSTDWDLEVFDPLPPPTYEAGEFPNTTVTPGATTGLGQTFTMGSDLILDADKGRQIVNLSGSGRATITGVSGTSITVDIVEDFPNTNAIAANDWKLDLSPIAELTPSGTKAGSVIDIEADDPGTSTDYETFRSGDVGRYIILNGGVVKIISITDSHTAKCLVLKTLDSTDETLIWTMEDKTWDATRKYPRSVTIHNQRLCFGGNEAEPQSIWLSAIGLFDDFGFTVGDADAFTASLSTAEIAQVNWLISARSLTVGTSGGEITLEANGALTPLTTVAIPRTSFGSPLQIPLLLDSEVIYYDKTSKHIRSFRYDFNIDGYQSENLTIAAENIVTDTIVEMDRSTTISNYIYAVTDQGDLLVGAYDRASQIMGWTKYQDATGSYENVRVLTNGERDEVWVVVKRTIDGGTKRYVERFDWGAGTDRLDGFSDSYLTYSDPKAISGITKANPPVVTTATHGYSNDDVVKLIDVGGMTEVEGKSFTVKNKTSTTFELYTTDPTPVAVDGSNYTAYTSGGEAHKLVSSVTGVDHLEGQTVQVKADGAAHPDATVSSGVVTLQFSAYEVTVGLEYSTTIKTLPKDIDLQLGSTIGQQTRRINPILKVYRSSKPMINSELLPARSSADNMDSAVPLTSGNLDYGPLNWDDNDSITITTSEPLPLYLNAIFGTSITGVK